MHDEHAGHVAVALGNGRVLVAGGQDAVAMLDRVELYDPAADAWTADAPMHDAREFFAAALLPDGRVLVSGGMTSIAAPADTRYTAELYLPTTGTACAAPADCPTGFCVDHVCCDTACDGACTVCARASGATFDGVCTTLPEGAGGVCTRTCVSVHDCPPPDVCGPEGRRAAPPPWRATRAAAACPRAPGVALRPPPRWPSPSPPPPSRAGAAAARRAAAAALRQALRGRT